MVLAISANRSTNFLITVLNVCSGNKVATFLDEQTIEVESTFGKQKYTFDRIFESESVQHEIFDDAI